VREKLLALSELQKVDLEIAALKKSADAYPRDIQELEKQLGAAKSALDAERTRLEELDRQRQHLEHTISDEKDKVRKWEARLTEQRSTREYSALAREIDIAKKGQQTMSEELSELGKQATLQREVVKQKDGAFQATAQEINGRITELKGKLKAAQDQIAGIGTTRAEAAKKVDASLLRRYDHIRAKRMPALVALTAPGTCGGCRMTVRSQLYNSLVANKGYDTCPSCQRLVYAEETLAETQA